MIRLSRKFQSLTLSLLHFHSVWQSLNLVAWPLTHALPAAVIRPLTCRPLSQSYLLSSAVCTLRSVICSYPFVHAPGRTLSFSLSPKHTEIHPLSHYQFELQLFVHLLTLTLSFNHSLSVTVSHSWCHDFYGSLQCNDATCNGLDESSVGGYWELSIMEIQLEPRHYHTRRYCLFYCCSATLLNLEAVLRIR